MDTTILFAMKNKRTAAQQRTVRYKAQRVCACQPYQADIVCYEELGVLTMATRAY